MCVQFKVIVAQKNEDITNRKAMFFEQRITKKCTTDASFAGVSFRQPEKYINHKKTAYQDGFLFFRQPETPYPAMRTSDR